MNYCSLSISGFLEDCVLVKLYGAFGFGEKLLDSNPLYYWGLTALLAIFAYLLGSVNFSIVISKLKYHDDIRNYGSHNAGFTNMKRIYGSKAGFAAIAGDILKGVVSVGVTLVLLGEDPAYLVGLACILGHCFPVYYGFKGGKGVATTAAMILVLEPIVFVMVFIIFASMTAVSRYLSLGSISAALLYPLFLNRFYNAVYGSVILTRDEVNMHITESPIILLASIGIALFVIFNHKSNIKRIWNGTENKFSLKSKGMKESSAEPEKAPRSLHNIDKDDEQPK